MSGPALAIEAARPRPDDLNPLAVPVTLHLQSGELALVRAEDAGMARALAELCAGLPALAEGHVRLLGEDVAALPRPQAEALRSRIGIAPGEGEWLPHLSMPDNVVLARRHHGDGPEVRAQADDLARHFGLDGVPRTTPHELSRLDLARAACVRAFLGKPDLLLLEAPLDAEAADVLFAPLRSLLDDALARGVAAVWMTRSPRAWEDGALPAARRLRLGTDGLVPA